MASGNLEEKTKEYYEFKPSDFIPIVGTLHYNRRTLNGYLDECKEAGKRFIPSTSAKIAPRRILLILYSLAFAMGAAKLLEAAYDKL